jgi:prevent-host-death family protein
VEAAPVKIVNMHEAKTHLSRLVEAAAQGEPFIIARAGKPLVQVMMIAPAPVNRTGFLKGQIDCPDDFTVMAEDEIAALFAGREDGAAT